jgi:hypothetical protein
MNRIAHARPYRAKTQTLSSVYLEYGTAHCLMASPLPTLVGRVARDFDYL